MQQHATFDLHQNGSAGYKWSPPKNDFKKFGIGFRIVILLLYISQVTLAYIISDDNVSLLYVKNFRG